MSNYHNIKYASLSGIQKVLRFVQSNRYGQSHMAEKSGRLTDTYRQTYMYVRVGKNYSCPFGAAVIMKYIPEYVINSHE